MFLDAAVGQDGAVWFEYLKPFLEVLVPILASGIGVAITYLLKRALDFFKEKHGFELAEQDQKRIQQSLLDGIALAEQQTIKALKQGADAPDSAKKLKIAVDYVYDSLKEQGYGEVPAEKIEQWIEILLTQITQYESSGKDGDPIKDKLATVNSLYLGMAHGNQFFLNGKNKTS